jgi:hypothetical protein
VWYNIADGDANNDDAATGGANGNGLERGGQTNWIEAQRVNPSIQIDSDYPLEWRFNYVNIPSSGAATIRVKLAEYSSSTNPLVSDADGRFTTLARAVNASGPDYRMNMAWPQRDGDTCLQGYDMKVHFSENLAHWDEAVTRSRFLITLNGVAQDRDAMSFNYYIDGGTHELAFPLPDLFNGDPNYEHQIVVTHTNAAGQGITLYAERRVRVPTGSEGPAVLIIDPPEFDLNGDRYRSCCRMSPARRRSSASTTSACRPGPTRSRSGSPSPTRPARYAPIPAATNALSGTVSVTSNSTTVTGSGTAFDGRGVRRQRAADRRRARRGGPGALEQLPDADPARIPAPRPRGWRPSASPAIRRRPATACSGTSCGPTCRRAPIRWWPTWIPTATPPRSRVPTSAPRA